VNILKISMLVPILTRNFCKVVASGEEDGGQCPMGGARREGRKKERIGR
jgi:hypothetical protein